MVDLSFLKQEYEALVQQGLDWRPPVLHGPSVARPLVAGKEVVMLCSNNYLGLSNHPRLKEAAIRAVQSHGVGSGAVRPIIGSMDIHLELEQKLAKFKKAEASLFYSSCYAVNAGLIPALVGEGDVIISDELNHGSIVDGVRLSKAERMVYKHCDMESLASVLREVKKKNPRRILLISDGVFSMDGDVCPLPEIVELAEQHGAMVYIDDAHGDGVFGDHGRGIASHFGVRVDFDVSSFSKAFGVVGGAVSGNRDVVNFALNKSRTWLLSGSNPPSVVAACAAAIDLLEEDDSLVKKLWKNARYFKDGLVVLGFDIGKSQSPIIPVMLGESSLAKKFSQRLFEEGVMGFPIIYPMVAKDKARIRCIVNAGLSNEDLDFALNAFEKVGKELEVI